jgi:hypothetical protein
MDAPNDCGHLVGRQDLAFQGIASAAWRPTGTF